MVTAANNTRTMQMTMAHCRTELGREAIDAAEAAGWIFLPYDNDGDGNLERDHLCPCRPGSGRRQHPQPLYSGHIAAS